MTPKREEALKLVNQINSLPDKIRNYIHDIESRCDPSGDVRELTIARDIIHALEAELQERDKPVKVTDLKKATNLAGYPRWRCVSCSAMSIEKGDRYCSNCGRRLEWV